MDSREIDVTTTLLSLSNFHPEAKIMLTPILQIITAKLKRDPNLGKRKNQ